MTTPAGPYYVDESVTLHHGDCLDVLQGLPDNSIDAVVTDPPYGLEFMGKDWDAPWKRGDDINADAGMTSTGYTDGGNRLPRPTFTGSTNPKCQDCGGTRRGRRDGTAKVKVCLCESGGRFPNVRAAEMLAFQQWCQLRMTEALRVLKPGGHLLAFGGTRTWHRLAVAVEDAGFEVRDSIAWLYGSGFPKSLNVSKAIDKAAPRAGLFDAFAAHYAERRKALGLTHNAVCAAVGAHGEHNHGGASVNWEKGYGVPTREQWSTLSALLGMPHEMWAPLIERAEAEREVTGRHLAGVVTGDAGMTVSGEGKDRRDIPATPLPNSGPAGAQPSSPPSSPSSSPASRSPAPSRRMY